MPQTPSLSVDQLADALCAQMPWRADGTRVIRDAGGAIVASAREGCIDDAIARRIVACVNACAGIDTARLEGFSLLDFRESAMDVVRNWERGDLAGAVNNLEGAAEVIGGTVDMPDLEPA